MSFGNPIKSVDGVPFNLCPSKYQYGLQDVSSADAGRTEDGNMDKERITQKVKLNLEWSFVSIPDASTILNAFDPEYIEVEYLDAKAGGFVTKTFYVGDRSVPLYNSYYELWENVAFNIIER